MNATKLFVFSLVLFFAGASGACEDGSTKGRVISALPEWVAERIHHDAPRAHRGDASVAAPAAPKSGDGDASVAAPAAPKSGEVASATPPAAQATTPVADSSTSKPAAPAPQGVPSGRVSTPATFSGSFQSMLPTASFARSQDQQAQVTTPGASSNTLLTVGLPAESSDSKAVVVLGGDTQITNNYYNSSAQAVRGVAIGSGARAARVEKSGSSAALFEAPSATKTQGTQLTLAGVGGSIPWWVWVAMIIMFVVMTGVVAASSQRVRRAVKKAVTPKRINCAG